MGEVYKARDTRLDLDAHVALQPRIARTPDLAHPSPAQQLHDLEVAQFAARTQCFDRR
jgi:hypothetical protein